MHIGTRVSKNYWLRIIEPTFPVIVLPGRWDKIDCRRQFLSPVISIPILDGGWQSSNGNCAWRIGIILPITELLT